MLNSETVNDEGQPALQGRRRGEKPKTQRVKVKNEDAMEELNLSIFSKLKKKFSKKKFSVDNILETEKIRSDSEEYVEKKVVVMAYYYPGGILSVNRDYLSSKKIDFDKKENLYEYAPQILACTKLSEAKQDKTAKRKERYLVKGKIRRIESSRLFGSLLLEVQDFDPV